jgi:hypothetical protein
MTAPLNLTSSLRKSSHSLAQPQSPPHGSHHHDWDAGVTPVGVTIGKNAEAGCLMRCVHCVKFIGT